MESNSNPDKKKKLSLSNSGNSSNSRMALLLGLGLDSQDEHVRITRGPNFHLIGGRPETHEVMQETAVKFNEELVRRGKRLDQVGPTEFLEIMNKLK